MSATKARNSRKRGRDLLRRIIQPMWIEAAGERGLVRWAA